VRIGYCRVSTEKAYQDISIEGQRTQLEEAGPQGIDGAVGAAGPQGEVGPAGTIGPDGPAGVQGVRGTGWFTGTGAPTDVPGSVPGDLYLESLTGDVYVLN